MELGVIKNRISTEPRSGFPDNNLQKATPTGLACKVIHIPPVSFHFTGGYLQETPNGVLQVFCKLYNVLIMSQRSHFSAFLLICYKIIDKNVADIKLISTFAAAFERKALILTS
jgi:hypothetical protein